LTIYEKKVLEMLPLLHGLLGTEPNAEDMSNSPAMSDALPLSIDDLTSDELEMLQSEADQAQASGALDGIELNGVSSEETEEVEESDSGSIGTAPEEEETAADEAMESESQQAQEQEAGTELHSTTEFIEQAKAAYDECSSLIDQLKEAVDTLEDAKEAKSLLSDCKDSLAEAKELANAADDASDSDDIHMAAESAAKIDGIKQGIADAIAQVAEMKQAEEQAAAEEEAAEAPEMTQGASAKVPGQDIDPACNAGAAAPKVASKGGLGDHPLALWAKRAMGTSHRV
jgi:hypothetical protein